jgi:hypothetical protein
MLEMSVQLLQLVFKAIAVVVAGATVTLIVVMLVEAVMEGDGDD